MFGMVIAVHVNVIKHHDHHIVALIVVVSLFLLASLGVWGLRVSKYVHNGAFKALIHKSVSRKAFFLLLLCASISSLYLLFLRSLVLV